MSEKGAPADNDWIDDDPMDDDSVEPWKTRSDWAKGEAKGAEKGNVLRYWFGTLGMGALIAYGQWHSHIPIFSTDAGPFAFILWFFPATFIYFLINALWETLRLKCFGNPPLKLKTIPGRLGGSLEGRISIRSSISIPSDFTLQLECIHRVVTEYTKSTQTKETVLWSASGKAQLKESGKLPISMPIPKDQPPTRLKNPKDCISWRLNVTSSNLGLRFSEEYEVPIF